MDTAPDRPALREHVLRELLLAPAGPLARLDVVERTGSTNVDLAAALRADPEAWPHPSLLAAEAQDSGRGRAGRTWETPARSALMLSFALRPAAPLTTYGWLPLLAGLGAVNALRATVGVPAVLKWPNDVMVPAPDGTDLAGWGPLRKVGGILTELVTTPAGSAVVVGIGINVSQAPGELPVPSATSLALAGGRDVDREMLLVALVSALAEVTARWSEHGGDVHAAGLVEDVSAVCATLGTQVRVELPGGREVTGTAQRLDREGALVVVDASGAEHQVLAGDVHHVRRAR
ncbi:biotin--[acetyl-CoA-carboxylase] ligase [Cellulomonas sp. NS3]|uniref:biotin--[acetyl-CoA-carboxylase] ligase n=1 Tax=Cellulomonas sp. NS3 TaxID=2973977 RepID=UPI0021620DCC|nr:biotin--[acetyl-CoA-carboxylase] ligase [Cellulomonas sp. NS3]